LCISRQNAQIVDLGGKKGPFASHYNKSEELHKSGSYESHCQEPSRNV
jgi:hypothetical protein